MSNVQECIDLYLTDTVVTDAQFRAILEDAVARDVIDDGEDPIGPTAVRSLLARHGHALVLLNRVDDRRSDQIEALDKRIDKLTGFCDSLAGQVRVLRERLDNLEGK